MTCLLPEGIELMLEFCPTGEGGGVDPHCSPGGGTATLARPKNKKKSRKDAALRYADQFMHDRHIDGVRQEMMLEILDVAMSNLKPSVSATAINESIDGMIQSMNNMPDDILQAIADDPPTFHIVNTEDDIHDVLIDRPNPIRAPEGVIGAGFFYSFPKGELGDAELAIDGLVNEIPEGGIHSSRAEIAAHEFGHVADYLSGKKDGGGFRTLKSKEWLDLWERDISTPFEKGEVTLSRYATIHPIEGWAETFRAHSLNPKAAEAKFPDEIKWARDNGLIKPLRDLMLEFCPTGPGGGVDPTCSPGGAALLERALGTDKAEDWINDPATIEKLRNCPEITFKPATPSEFKLAQAGMNRSPYLSAKTEAELAEIVAAGGTLQLSEDGKTGYVLTVEGDAQNLFNNGGKPGAGTTALIDQISKGAKTLDCFDPHLPRLYNAIGFKAYDTWLFNDAYAPAGWDYAKNGRPDVVLMRYEGRSRDAQEIRKAIGTHGKYVNTLNR